MLKNDFYVLGVMSGTSLDGLDLAAINFSKTARGWRYIFGTCATVGYPAKIQNSLRDSSKLSRAEIEELDIVYTALLAEYINAFIADKKISSLDYVCSHGHTVFHEPERGITKQIGNRPELATLINLPVVCDFRVQDVALGGQGAPLVPIGDQLLFSDYDYCLNLGGFANVSFSQNGQRLAYDLGPANIVLNPLARELGVPFDDRGKLARSGTLNNDLLHELNGLPYYNQTPPKSLGIEWIQQVFNPVLAKYNLAVNDLLRTLVEHIAQQIANPLTQGMQVLVTGGGAYNNFLLERISANKNVNIVIPEPQLLEYKEALIFGLLGVLKVQDKVNCLASVTGAQHDHSSGKIFNP